ncbi:MAG: ribosomal protein S18-alanine N-acetyltransferase [Thaumarchaeota archaeon]|nr:ribosomal protein S18-alanine N-acetyltransferase [Nitrososphaerota archaeon]
MQPTFHRQVGSYIIRQCTRQDLPNVIRINFATLPEHYSDLFFEELLKESPETFIVADSYDTIVGYIMCRIEFGFSNVKKFGLARKGHIVSVSVVEEHRKKGLGRALMEEAMRGMVTRGCSEVFLEVRVSNTSAISIYQKMGFPTTSRLEGYYRDGEAAYLMAKPLTPPT